MLCANQKELKSRLVELDKSALKIASIQTSFVSKDFFMNNFNAYFYCFHKNEEGNSGVSAGHSYFSFLATFLNNF